MDEVVEWGQLKQAAFHQGLFGVALACSSAKHVWIYG
jgi:hypothetical protein